MYINRILSTFIHNNTSICLLEYKDTLQWTVEGRYTLGEGLCLKIMVPLTSSKLSTPNAASVSVAIVSCEAVWVSFHWQPNCYSWWEHSLMTRSLTNCIAGMKPHKSGSKVFLLCQLLDISTPAWYGTITWLCVVVELTMKTPSLIV